MPSPAACREPAFYITGLDVRYTVYVEPPPSGGAAGEWPVVLCLDGDDQFAALCKARATVADRQVLPPLLLVGLGYGSSYQEPGNRRGRDYTPCPIQGADEGGGADAFLEFLIAQVWPELVKRYPVHATTRGIAGHSLGALFALHALFKPSPFFNRVLASAPSIWWGERAILQTVASLQTTGVALPAHLFAGVGTRDSRSMVTDLELLETQLAARPFPALQTTSTRFAGKNHFNAIDAGFTAGLTALFPA